MTGQASLPLSQKAPSVSEREVLQFVLRLQGQGWQTAKSLGMPERKARALASASEGQILGGQKGYCLTREATDDDADHAEAFLLSQARKMTDRARQIRIARNRRQSAA
jgi:hypothetical protein